MGCGPVPQSAEPVKTQVTDHVFHYPTHSVVWEVFYGPRQPGLSFELPSATDGMGLQVWCDFFLTREAAERAVGSRLNDSPVRLFAVDTIVHPTGG